MEFGTWIRQWRSKYNYDLHQKDDVLMAQKPLNSELFNDEKYVLIQHSVADFSAWYSKFLTFEGLRESYQMDIKCVLTHYNDPNNVMVIASYKNIVKVNEYGVLITDGKVMENAGVISKPEILLMSK